MNATAPVAAAATALCFLALPGRAADDFVPLFNGRDFTGWVNVNCAPDTWQVTNGLIFCTGKPIGELRTARMYQNFVLELEWRHLQPQGNAGVFVWADALTARGQPFIRGIEVQVLDGREGPTFTSDGDIFPIHGATMVPENARGGDRAFPTEKRMKPSPEWNHYRIECVDGHIALAVNGKVVTRGHECSPRKGYLCLESEGSPIEFRNLRIQELPAGAALAPEHIAHPDEGYRSLYSGVDLSGWQVSAAAARAWKVNDWILEGAGGGPEAALRSEAEFGDFSLILDWRWKDKNRAGDWTKLLRLRGHDLSQVLRGGPAPGRVAGSAGGWVRVECTLRGHHLRARINDPAEPPVTFEVSTNLPDIPAKGPLTLAPPDGPIQVANAFIKVLD